MNLYDDKILNLEKFKTIFSDLLKTNQNDWLSVISNFKYEFEKGLSIKASTAFEKSDLILSNSNTEHFYLTGFDMPCWISNEDSKKKIMILASEPLRSEDSWGESDKYETISLNTPFSYHLSKIENNRKERFRYWDLIDWIVGDLKSTVYLTDIRKFWFAGWEHYKAFHSSEIHINIFKQELDFVKPDLIIIFGSRPLNILQSEKLLDLEINLTKHRLPENGFKLNNIDGYKVLPLIHPSGAAGGPRKKFFEVNNVSGENQNEMYKEIIKRFVN